MEAPHTTESHQPTPEQLLTLLELQIVSERSRRAGRKQSRSWLLVTGILFIIVAAGVALVVAQGMIANLAERGGLPDANQSAETR